MKKQTATTTVHDVMELMEALAPARLACAGDPIGLHAGTRRQPVRKVLLALDATAPVIRHAVTGRYDLLLTHHPFFYKGLKSLDEDQGANALAADVARARLAIFSAHTNLDATIGGVNDVLADLAGMGHEREPVEITVREPVLKLSVFVPESHLQQVREAICDAGAGRIGNYTDCTYRVAGTGSFRPGVGANPFIGTAGTLEEVAEWRVEAVLPQSVEQTVVRALRDAHPYEEPAFDLVTMRQEIGHGIGRVGALTKETTIAALARKAKKATGCPGAVMLADGSRKVRRIAVWGGSGIGASTILRTRAEVLICGELSYHEAATLQERGVGAIVLGHGPSEQPVLERLAGNLREGLPGVQIDCCPPLWPLFTTVS